MIGRLMLRLGVTVTTLAALAVPTLTFVYVRDRVQVGAQVMDLPAPPMLTAQRGDQYASFARGAATGMVVLGYHDVVKNEPSVAPESGRRVSVSAANLAAHLRMLRLAGFESVSASDVARYVLSGSPPPRRSVMITFDGARVRDWTYADRILRDYGFQATVFVDPTIVDAATRGTTLSWAQLRALVGTGRWSVGVLPSVLAGPVAVDAGGRRESGIVAHRWLPDRNRPETTEEFTARVHDALTRSRQRIVDQGLPSPALLSYPFQADYPLDRVSEVFGELSTAVQALFSASVLTSATDEISGTQWIGRRLLPRIEIYSSTTDEVLFARIAEGLSR